MGKRHEVPEPVEEKKKGRPPATTPATVKEPPDGDAPNPVDKWYTAKQAAKVLEVALSRIYVMADAGDLPCELDSNGVKRFDPEVLESMAPSGVVLEVQRNQTDVLRVAQQTVAMLLAQQKQYLDLLPDAIEKTQRQQQALIDKQAGIIDAMHAENLRLRTERAEMISAYEASLTAAHERDLSRELSKRRADLADRAWGDVVQLAPTLVAQVLLGGDMQKLLAEIDPAFLEVLTTDASPLPPEQRERIRSILTRLDVARKTKGNGASKEPPAPDAPAPGSGAA